MNLLDMMFKGGVIMWPILGCSLIGAYVVIERILVLRRAQVDVSEFMRKLRSLCHRGEFSAVLTYCEEKNAPVANIIRRGLLKHGEGPEKVREAIENAGREEVYHLERRLSLLASVAGVAPMLGFLGTVTGMIAAFHAVEIAGGVVSPGDLAGRIWEALLTTAFGLIVGIPALLVYDYFAMRVQKFVHVMEVTSTEFIDMLEGFGQKSPAREDGGPHAAAARPVAEEDEFFRPKRMKSAAV
jgi:biopolymer transport protein ExbB